ncbi:MAG: zinc metalloprotease [Flavisolibacter sp.]
MRKVALALCAVVLVFTACKKSATTSSADEQQAITKRSCASYEVLQAQLLADPTMKLRMDQIEAFTARVIQSGRVTRGTTIEIPVVVHVVYNTAAQNIADAQVQSQIDVLNEDYSATNKDIHNTPSLFTKVTSSGFGVHFTLAQTRRVQTKLKSFNTNDAVKSTQKGGDDAVDPTKYLNVWACNLGQKLLGYAQFPGGPVATDGVVILYSAFGSRAKDPSGTFISTYDLGRTATHEIGHWMNLRHIWGDDGGSCSGTDYVDDTPNQASQNFGCPTFPHVSCSNNGDMSMNYMDYTDDACMYMFSMGQQARALAVFAPGGPRAVLAGN